MAQRKMVNSGRQEFDVIVIGSGIGGLTCAALLSKFYRKRVLVLEQHFTVGGFTHGFDRKGKFHWDVGVHYIGEMEEGGTGRDVFNYITNGKLKWQKMADPFEKFIYPNFTFDVYSGAKRFQNDLIQKFPREKKALQKYFKDIKKAAFWFIGDSMLEIFPVFLHPLLRRIYRHFGKIGRQSTQSYLDKNFKDIQLKALLVSQWGDYGLPPCQSSFGTHSSIVVHFLEGGWHPVGGGKQIPDLIVPTIEQSGGIVITQRKVTEIIIKNGVAVGVKVQNMGDLKAELEIYHAPTIVSNAGAFNTYVKLIPPSVPIIFRNAIKDFEKGTNVLSLYLGLKEDPRKLGFQGENHWIHSTYYHNSIIEAPPIDADNLPQFAYLSFPSLKNTETKGHTAEIIVAGHYDFFSQWQNEKWKRRGDDYQELKDQITDSIIKFVENQYPGFQDLIEYAELATPLTFEHFGASDRGAIYGIPCTTKRFDLPWANARTPIKNLYLTGVDTFPNGIMGAMMGGVKTAGLIDGHLGFLTLMAVMTHK
jgi:all-trans-retinol 13,14-reductase